MKVFATYIQVLLHTYTLILICNLRMHIDTRNNVFDLEMQPFYIFLCDTYILHTIGLGLLLYALGGFPFIIWGIVRKQNAFTGLDYVVQLCSMFIVINIRLSTLNQTPTWLVLISNGWECSLRFSTVKGVC